jgi:5-methylthioadenosine/S-adenosylhomocysteine deaminase
MRLETRDMQMTSVSQHSETVLVNGLILADPGSGRVVPHGQTVVSGARLSEVNQPLNETKTGATVIDCSNCLIMPGLVNAHTHAAMSLLRGIGDDLPLSDWLRDYIFPAEARYADPEFVYLGASLAAMEMALSGVTTYADGYFHMKSAADAAKDVGLRAVIAQGILDVPTPDAPEPNSWRKRVEAFLADCPEDPLITPALFCHSPYLCSPRTIKEAREITREQGLRFFCHVAETQTEVQEVSRRHGEGPVEHLHRLGALGPDFVAVHAVHLSDAEKRILAETDTRVVHCPVSNMKLASGAAPVWDLIKRGVVTALGTDSAASNNNLDMLEEMRVASLLAKLATGDPESLPATAAVRMATIDGAKALGLEESIGALEKGKLADLIVIDFDQPHLTPLYDPVSHLVYSARGSDVRDVIVNGRIIVRNGQMVSPSHRGLKSRVTQIACKIQEGLGLADYGACR